MRDDFDLADFLPYALNRAAERTGEGFQRIYRDRYGLTRTEWRVLFHLGRHGEMSARDICAVAGLHKTKVSRAVSALEARRYLSRTTDTLDRRVEHLSLTKSGRGVFGDLEREARHYDRTLLAQLSEGEIETLRRCLAELTQGDN